MEKQKLKINRKLIEKEKEFEVRADIIVPDIKPDIVAVKNTNTNIYIRKEEIILGKMRLEGNIDGYVSYLSESGETRSLEISLDFIESIEDEKIEENCKVKEIINVKNIETKMLNERKISVTAVVVVEASFFSKQEIEFITNVEDEKIQVREEKFKIKRLLNEGFGNANLRENIETENNVAISEILKVDTELSNIENKISINKVLSKADLNINIVYQTEDLKEEKISYNYPVTSFIEIENIKDSDICETDFVLRKMMLKVDSVMSNKIVLEMSYDINLDIYEESEIQIIQDMYSLDKQINIKRSEVNMSIGGEERKISYIESIEEKELENRNEYSMVVYFVKPQDTVWEIAKMFNVTMASIIEANNLEDPDKINVGEKLYIVK